MLFFNLGGSEIMLILLVVLLLFGSSKIPELARGLGKGIREFTDATNWHKARTRNKAWKKPSRFFDTRH